MVDYKQSTVTRGPYSDILSIYDSIARKPQALAELIRQFGDAFYVTNFLNLAGRTIDITTPNLKIIEEGAPERPVTVSITTTAANVQADLTFASADGSDDYVREGFDLLIPSTYTNATITKPMRIYLVGSDWKGRFYDETTTLSTVTTKEFVLGASSFGYGTGQPQPMASGFYERYTSDRIMKETAGIEGAQLYQEDYEAVEMANGGQGILSRATIEADFRLDSQMDSFLLTGQDNTNSNLTAVSGISGGTSAIPSADGMDNIMEELALALTWSTGFDITKFEAVKGLLESVGILNRTVDFFAGTGLCTSIEQNMESYLNANSAGHSLYDMITSKVGFNVREIQKNSVTFKLMELHSFSNPNKFGAAEYDYRNNGYMFPEGEHKVKWNGAGAPNEEVSLPHLTLGYPVGKGENRRRTISTEYGVTNLSPVASNDLDGWKYYFSTHVIPIWVHMQKTVRISKV